MTGGPFAVDVEAALDALDLAWGDEYDEIWISDGKAECASQGCRGR